MDKEIKWLNPSELNGDEVERLWEKLQLVPEASDDRLHGRVDYFLASFFNGTQYVKLGDIGLAVIAGSVPGADANVHVAIWDKSEPAKAFRLIKETLQYVFKEFNLHRCTTQVGELNQDAIRTARLLGFQIEGKMRECFLSKGKFQDVIVLGLLRKEFLEEEV